MRYASNVCPSSAPVIVIEKLPVPFAAAFFTSVFVSSANVLMLIARTITMAMSKANSFFP